MPPKNYKKYYEFYGSNDPEAIAIRKTVFKENIDFFKSMNPSKQYNYTDEQIDGFINDKDKLELFVESNKYFEKHIEKSKLYKTLMSGENKIDVDRSMNRQAAFYFDVSGTEEAEEKNRKLVDILSDKEKTRDFFSQETSKIVNFDFNKLADCKTDKDYLMFKNENSALVETMWVFNSGTSGIHGFTEEGLKSSKNLITAIEVGGQISSFADLMASPYYLTTPGPIDENMILSMEAEKRKGDQEKYPNICERTGLTAKINDSFTSIYNPEFYQKLFDFSKGLRVLRDEKHYDISNFLIDFKAVDKSGETIGLGDAIEKFGANPNTKEFKLVKTTPKERAINKQIFEAPFLMNKVIGTLDRRLKDIENEVDQNVVEGENKNITRGVNRVAKIKNEIEEIISPTNDSYYGKHLTINEKYYMSIMAIKQLEDKNAARGNLWKVFNIAQNSEEKGEIAKLKAMVGRIFNKESKDIEADLSMTKVPSLEGIQPLTKDEGIINIDEAIKDDVRNDSPENGRMSQYEFKMMLGNEFDPDKSINYGYNVPKIDVPEKNLDMAKNNDSPNLN